MEARRDVFERVFEDHLDEVQRLIRRHTSSEDDMLDLTQDIFIRAYSAFSRFRDERVVNTWLHRIAIDVCYTAAHSGFKLHGYNTKDENPDWLAVLCDRLEDIAYAQDQRVLRQAVNSLPPEQILVLTLRFSDQLTIQDITQVIGTPLDVSRIRLRTALARVHAAVSHQSVADKDIYSSNNSTTHRNYLSNTIKQCALSSLYIQKSIIEAVLREWVNAQDAQPTLLDSYFKSADKLIEIDQPHRAIDLLETAVNKVKDAALHTIIAKLYLNVGNIDGCLGHAKRAIDLKPGSPEAHYIAGRCYSKQAELQAVLSVPHLLSGTRNSHTADSHRKAAYHFEQAAKHHCRLSLEDRDTHNFEVKAFINDCDHYSFSDNPSNYSLDRFNAAEIYLRYSISENPTAMKLGLLAEMQIAKGEIKEANALLVRALDLVENEREKSILLTNLSRIDLMLERHDDALEHAQLAVETDETNDVAYNHLKAIEIKPDGIEAEESLLALISIEENH